jgi:hypothetical protein
MIEREWIAALIAAAFGLSAKGLGGVLSQWLIRKRAAPKYEITSSSGHKYEIQVEGIWNKGDMNKLVVRLKDLEKPEEPTSVEPTVPQPLPESGNDSGTVRNTADPLSGE